jgi:hypothetical protein
MGLASVIIAALAFVFSVIAWLDGRRRATNADRAALASAAEAAKSADAAVRSAVALEQQASISAAAASRYEVPWVLMRARGSMWRLTNANRAETAYGVTIEAVDPQQHLSEPPTNVDIPPGGAIEFFGLSMYDEVTSTDVRVRWRRTPEGPEEIPWVHPTG